MADVENKSPNGYKHDPAFDSGFLKVSSIHRIHYEQYGNETGKPVVFLHGGPGGSTSINSTIFFDPAVYRVVLFDQRGAGKSEPAAETRENTSQLLVTDIETLRQHLGIEKWFMVFGGSWGSTLALLYGQTHPDRVGSFVLRGVSTARKVEYAFTRGPEGAARLFPEEYQRYVNAVPPADRNITYPFFGFQKLVSSEDPKIRLEAARAFSRWDCTISSVVTEPDVYDVLNDDRWVLQHSMLEIHYQCNGAFIEDGQLLRPENVGKINHLPCELMLSTPILNLRKGVDIQQVVSFKAATIS